MQKINIGKLQVGSEYADACILCDCEGCIRAIDNDHCSCCDMSDWFDVKD